MTMQEENGKIQFTSKVRKQGGSLVTTIPASICKHDNIKEGDTLKWQAEHSTDYGTYESIWNQTKQERDEK